MKISSLYANTVEFFREHKRRYGCIAAVERMLLSQVNEEIIEKEEIIPVVDKQTQYVPLYDTAIPYNKEKYEEDEKIRQEIEARKHRNRPPRRK